MSCVVVHYHEIGLKGKNRPYFERKLIKNIKFALSHLPVKRVQKMRSRVVIHFQDTDGEVEWEEVKKRLKKVCGIANFSPATLREAEDLEALCQEIYNQVEHLDPESFAIQTKRSDKSYPLTSPEINSKVGAYIQSRTKWPVNLDDPDLAIQIEMLSKRAIFYTQKVEGPGGLPIGVSGPALCLISGGIDSPVAAYRLLKRGCEVPFLHFHSYPFTDQASIEKVKDTIQILARHRFRPRLYLVPFADAQREMVAKTKARYRVLLYRRFMMRIAQALAREIGAPALVTGESLSQVASQTLENLSSIQSAVTIPILRPLVGMDKQEIIREAKELGTFEISIRPHEDCCSYLMPRNPATKSTPEELEEVEKDLEVERIVLETMEKIEREEG